MDFRVLLGFSLGSPWVLLGFSLGSPWVLLVCQAARHWQTALDMLKSHPSPSDFALASTIKACGQRWQLCHSLVERMKLNLDGGRESDR